MTISMVLADFGEYSTDGLGVAERLVQFPAADLSG
jgi:hypothetical protein